MGIDEDIQRDERSSDEEEEEYSESGSDSEEQPEMVLFPLNPQDALYDKKSLRKEAGKLKEMRRANKKMVKAYKRERRKTKIPKKVKKRKIKVARRAAGRTVWHKK